MKYAAIVDVKLILRRTNMYDNKRKLTKMQKFMNGAIGGGCGAAIYFFTNLMGCGSLASISFAIVVTTLIAVTLCQIANY